MPRMLGKHGEQIRAHLLGERLQRRSVKRFEGSWGVDFL